LGIHSTRVVWFEDDPPEVWPRQAIAALTTHDLPTLAGMLSGGDSPPAMRHRLERLVGPLAGRDLLDVSVEVHHRLGASRAGLAVATLEDAVGVLERPNQPGTASVTNWSRALPVAVDDLPHHDGARRTLGALSTARPD
jgi:4-alpha-glucanotransferase